MNTESGSNAKSSFNSSSDASAASATSGSDNGNSDSAGERDDSTDGTSVDSASDSRSSSSSASSSSSSDDGNGAAREVHSLTVMAGEDGPVSFDVYGGVYTVTGVDERREEQAKRVTVPISSPSYSISWNGPSAAFRTTISRRQSKW